MRTNQTGTAHGYEGIEMMKMFEVTPEIEVYFAREKFVNRLSMLCWTPWAEWYMTKIRQINQVRYL